MLKWSIRIFAGLGFLLLATLGGTLLYERFDEAVVTARARNEALITFNSEWPGTPVDAKGRFVNEEYPFLPKMAELLKWRLGTNPQRDEKLLDTDRLKVLDPSEFLSGDEDGILWLGHASFYIRLNGKALLIDPIFGKPPVVSEYVHVPSPLDDIREVDYVLVTHDHRDHCDERTIRQITQKFPAATLIGGLGSADIFTEWKTEQNKISIAGWYQQLALEDDAIEIYFLPVRHWSRRGLFDTNRRLWGGFVIRGGGTTIYFGGDSGYGGHYRALARFFPEIDYFLIGIGGYKPRWFMEPTHNTPEEALTAFRESNARVLVPMHFGRFDMSDEPPSEPLRLLMESAETSGIADKIHSLQINESIRIH